MEEVPVSRHGDQAPAAEPGEPCSCRPAAGGEFDVRLTLPARAGNVALVRHVVGALAEAVRLPPPIVEDIKLAVTEACTNVVRHAYDGGTDPGPLEIVIRPHGDALDIIVSDRGRGIGPSPDTLGPGLGLPLIAAIAGELDFQPVPGGGSRLAMTFARDRAGDVA
jgi:anti-sigma regulatory factor (Ser/Thr protein kinase)